LYQQLTKIALGTRETVLEGKCKVLAIVKSADNSLMSQKFEIILMTVYSDRIGRKIAETNIPSVWRHILKFYSDKNNDVLFEGLTKHYH
jgi:hypothetical protein